MKKEWFVLRTLTGKERKAQEAFRNRVKIAHMEEFIGRCEVPTEKVTEKKNGKKHTSTRLVFPGYLLCELAFYDETRELDANGCRPIYGQTWQFLREVPGLLGFIDGNRTSGVPQPKPLTQAEVDAILNDKPVAAVEKARPKVTYAVGETVKVTDGAFMGLTGQVAMVDPDKGKLKVEVNIFNRKVQVDAECWQVERAPVEETLEEVK